jgi:dTDP-4-dehydrorhamnose reductase
MKNRVLVTGGTGMLGSAIIKALGDEYETISVSRTLANPQAAVSLNADLSEAGSAKAVIEKTRPDAVIHCAALTDVEECQRNPVKARAVNALATGYLVEAAAPETRFIYISTDAVFDGRRGMYSELDEPSCVNDYAGTKLEGEGFAKGKPGSCLILRINMIGHQPIRGQSLAEWVAHNLEAKRPIRMFTDIIFSPLWTGTLAGYIKRLLPSGETGYLHLGSRGGTSKYEFGCRLAGRLGLDASLIRPASVDGMDFLAKRPKNTTLDASKAEKILGRMPRLDREIDRWCAEERARSAVR